VVLELKGRFAMTQRHELRWGGLAGLAFLVLAFCAALIPGLPPRVTDSAGEITAYVGEGHDQLLLSALLWAASAGLVIWFSAAFAEAIREREERSDVHMALLAGSVLVGGALFMSAAGTAAMAYAADTAGAALTVTMFKGLMVLNTMIGFATVLPLTAAGIGVLRTKLMPDWLGYVALAAAVVSVITAFGIFATSGDYVPGGPVMSLVSLVAGGIFVLCASVFMVREHLPEVTQLTVPQT
jgi:hypothetical protein